MDSEKGLFIQDTLRKLNLKLNAVKEASTKLLPYTALEHQDLLIRIWDSIFHEKRNSEKERTGLFFVAHELLYRSNNRTFSDAFYEALLGCINHVISSEHEKLKQEIMKLIKLWTDHKIYDSQKLIRLTMCLTIEDQKKDELILSQMPENLPNPPSELISFAQNIKELKKFKERSIENEMKLQELYDASQGEPGAISAEMKAEINTTLSNLKRNLELQNKYRAFSLKSYKEVLNLIDKQHMKSVIELKLFLQKVLKINNLRDNLELP